MSFYRYKAYYDKIKESVSNRERLRIILQSLKASRGSNIKYKPYVFTEQGVYMLMTVLRGELAIQQSRALVKTFKRMKDYILKNCNLIGQRKLLQLSMETANNRIEISKINSNMISLEKQISDVAEGLKDVVTKSELADMMNSLFDNYIGLKTLVASSKDAGARITSIVEEYGTTKYNSVITTLLKKSPLVLAKQEREIIEEENKKLRILILFKVELTVSGIDKLNSV